MSGKSDRESELLARIEGLEKENKELRESCSENEGKLKALQAAYKTVERTNQLWRTELDDLRRKLTALEKGAARNAKKPMAADVDAILTFASCVLDKPEDRLFHAEDQTWWKRVGNTLLASDPPQAIAKLLEKAKKGGDGAP